MITPKQWTHPRFLLPMQLTIQGVKGGISSTSASRPAREYSHNLLKFANYLDRRHDGRPSYRTSGRSDTWARIHIPRCRHTTLVFLGQYEHDHLLLRYRRMENKEEEVLFEVYPTKSVQNCPLIQIKIILSLMLADEKFRRQKNNSEASFRLTPPPLLTVWEWV